MLLFFIMHVRLLRNERHFNVLGLSEILHATSS